MPHDSINILDGDSSSMSVVEGVCFVGQEAKNNTCWHFEVIRKDVNLVFHIRVVVEGIVVKVTKLRDVLL